MPQPPSPAARAARSRQLAQEELVELIAHALPADGTVEPYPGLYLHRRSQRTARIHGFYTPALCVIAQGSKELLLGDERFHYNPTCYMINTVDLPLIGQVVEATPDHPYLSLRLTLEPATVTAVLLELGGAALSAERGQQRAIHVNTLDNDLLDATLRLVRLTREPAACAALAPLVIREIIYRLLHSDQGDRLRHLAFFGGQAHRMTQAIERLRRDFDKPIRVEDLARDLGMSVSGFHAHFKAVTAMTPLRFQKQLRLQEARRLMLFEDLDAAEAGYRVGYEDASYFSRDYKRHFGDPPRRDVTSRKEELMSTGA